MRSRKCEQRRKEGEKKRNRENQKERIKKIENQENIIQEKRVSKVQKYKSRGRLCIAKGTKISIELEREISCKGGNFSDDEQHIHVVLQTL